MYSKHFCPKEFTLPSFVRNYHLFSRARLFSLVHTSFKICQRQSDMCFGSDDAAACNLL